MAAHVGSATICTAKEDTGMGEEDIEEALVTVLVTLPRDCRIRMASYLPPSELYGSYALTSTQCREDSLCTTLPQVAWGEVYCGSDVPRLLERLAHPSYQRAFSQPRTRLKLLGHTNLLRPDISWEDLERLARSATLAKVISLDLSVSLSSPSNEDYDDDAAATQRMQVHDVPMSFYPRSLSWALARSLPNLMEIDLSNLSSGPMEEGDTVSELSIFGNETSPHLSTIRWENRVGGCRFLRGNDLRTLENLKELHLDGLVADFRYDGGFGASTYGFFMECAGYESDRCIFFRCNSNLERVSLVGARYIDQETQNEHPLPQSMLIKFVQNTPKLVYFRSDLKQANVEMLREEKPEIVFC
mmetsp:Transcript_25057/g.54635  ORF Transcript_25057/g.54635 Transcript_25057/m.54635 type:complete len:358 (-) Transcript_25057:74-1147(-)|eukprot:CAMPEP_0178656820 /NCGR_PEP_ID=MMETSP0698-20121128/25026_1 /TAXON_ID=265572 /ORGANISM="Extubocellulus spinifer, Strain CCMP396" /LENGTH=357 /DNA_ID=CAMNT_0020298897 /DNA_START=12 /DNA_END=1085 /DNA_ORIENTATION=+